MNKLVFEIKRVNFSEKGPGNWDNTVMIILAVLWIAIAIIADIFTKKFGVGNLENDAMFWILNVAKDLLIIGGLLSIR